MAEYHAESSSKQQVANCDSLSPQILGCALDLNSLALTWKLGSWLIWPIHQNPGKRCVSRAGFITLRWFSGSSSQSLTGRALFFPILSFHSAPYFLRLIRPGVNICGYPFPPTLPKQVHTQDCPFFFANDPTLPLIKLNTFDPRPSFFSLIDFSFLQKNSCSLQLPKSSSFLPSIPGWS